MSAGKCRNLSLAVMAMVFLVSITGVTAKRSKMYSMPGSSCTVSLFDNYFREIDGAAIISSIKSNLRTCRMKFEADDSGLFSTNTLMMKFDRFNISNCQTTLKLYYGYSNSGTTPDVVLDCNTPPPRVIYTQNEYLTMVLDRGSDRSYDFQIVLTSFRTTTRCTRLTCRTDDDFKCVDRDLRCDHVSNCEKGYDEEGCMYGRMGASIKNTITAFIMLLIVVICIAVLVIYCRRRHAARNLGYTTTTVAVPVADQPGQPMPMSMQPGAGYPPAQPVYGSQAYPPYNAAGPPLPPAYSGYPPQGGMPPPAYPPQQGAVYPTPAGYGAAVPPYAAPPGGAYPPPPQGGMYPLQAPYVPPGSVGYTAGSDMVKMPPP